MKHCPTKKIGKIPNDITVDPSFIYELMVGYHPNALTIIVVGHFIVEYLINKIISAKCKNAKVITGYSFSVKLEFLYSIKLLPDDIYKNIKILNQARNKVVHTLESNMKSRNFYKSSGQKITAKIPKSKDPEKFYFKMLSHGILIGMRNYMMLKLKISPDYIT